VIHPTHPGRRATRRACELWHPCGVSRVEGRYCRGPRNLARTW
jgi:hypothetical protein